MVILNSKQCYFSNKMLPNVLRLLDLLPQYRLIVISATVGEVELITKQTITQWFCFFSNVNSTLHNMLVSPQGFSEKHSEIQFIKFLQYNSEHSCSKKQQFSSKNRLPVTCYIPGCMPADFQTLSTIYWLLLFLKVFNTPVISDF